jgi:transposase-like protein
MGQNLLNQPHLQNEQAANEFLVHLRWPDGIRCVRCQSDRVRLLKVKNTTRQVLKCYGCRKQFSAMVGTIFEDSHIPLTKWFTAMQLLCSSKKGMSAKQLQRMLGFKSYESAWFMAHRLRCVFRRSRPPIPSECGHPLERSDASSPMLLSRGRLPVSSPAVCASILPSR